MLFGGGLGGVAVRFCVRLWQRFAGCAFAFDFEERGCCVGVGVWLSPAGPVAVHYVGFFGGGGVQGFGSKTKAGEGRG